MAKLLAYLRPYWKSIAFVVCLVFIQVNAELQLPNLMSKIVNEGISKGDTNYIVRTGLIMLGVALFASFCSITASFFSSRNAMGAARDLRNGIFSKV